MIIIDEKGERKKYHLGESLNGVSAKEIKISTREIGNISNLQEYNQNTLRSRLVPGGVITIYNYVDGPRFDGLSSPKISAKDITEEEKKELLERIEKGSPWLLKNTRITPLGMEHILRNLERKPLELPSVEKWKQARFEALSNAIAQSFNGELEIKQEWIQEYNDYLRERNIKV